MDKNSSWLKFVITGKIDDYLSYKENTKKEHLNGGENIADYNGRTCDKRNDYQG